MIEPNRVTDNVGRKSVTLIGIHHRIIDQQWPIRFGDCGILWFLPMEWPRGHGVYWRYLILIKASAHVSICQCSILGLVYPGCCRFEIVAIERGISANRK